MSCMKKVVSLTASCSLIFGSVTANAGINHTNFKILTQEKQQQKPKKQIVEDNDYRFQLQGCQRKSQYITCNFVVTNLANQDRELLTWIESRIIDSLGNEYPTSFYQLGKTQGHSYSSISSILLQGVPVKGSFTFEVPKQITKLAVLEIVYGSGRGSKVEFRNINVTNSNSSASTRKK